MTVSPGFWATALASQPLLLRWSSVGIGGSTGSVPVTLNPPLITLVPAAQFAVALINGTAAGGEVTSTLIISPSSSLLTDSSESLPEVTDSSPSLLVVTAWSASLDSVTDWSPSLLVVTAWSASLLVVTAWSASLDSVTACPASLPPFRS